MRQPCKIFFIDDLFVFLYAEKKLLSFKTSERGQILVYGGMGDYGFILNVSSCGRGCCAHHMTLDDIILKSK